MGLPQTPSGLAHPIPNLLKWSDRSDICEKITERITHWYPEWKFRVEHVVTVLFVDDKQFDSEEGPLSVEQNIPPDLRDRLDLISPFCKHYMHHLDPENLNRAIWAHALHKPPVPQPKMSAEDDRNADWPTIARSMYWDSRFDTDPDLPTIAEAKPEEISKVCSPDKSRCVVTQSPEVKYFWFFPFTWNNSPPNNNATGNLESASVDLVDVDMLDSGILIAREIGNTHKSWNIMCIDRVLYDFVVRGWGGLRFEEAGEPNDKGIVKVKLRFYWMPQMTGRFNRECTNDKEMTEIANEFNAFVRAGCPPPPTYPKGEGFNIPKSGQLVEVERDACDVERFTSVVKIHWVCVVYTALCGGAGRPQFMTGKDQSYGHLEPRDEQFAHEKARLEKKDLVAQMAWKKYYQPSDDSGHGGSNSGSSGDTL